MNENHYAEALSREAAIRQAEQLTQALSDLLSKMNVIEQKLDAVLEKKK